jgi:hypothetical protein
LWPTGRRSRPALRRIEGLNTAPGQPGYPRCWSSHWRKAFKGFLDQGIGYDAALVALDLALLYLRQGRTAEVKRLARQMIPIFQAQDVHREALAALVLFQKAARREEVTVEQLLRLVKYLQEARTDPGMRWEDG